MPTAKKKTTKKKSPPKEESHRTGVWKGNISFGLVNIPIHLESAQQDKRISFNMLDKRDHARIGYKQINKKTGREIQRKDIVKGYEISKGQYVLMTDADFEKANVKATRTIDIEDFVELNEIDPMLFEKPYYIVPDKGGEKAYVLLREVLESTNKAAVAKVVLHTVQHLVAMFARDDYIVLEILRFAHEVKEVHEMHALPEKAASVKISDRELKVAEDLVKGMTSSWDPEKYKDTYQEDLMKLIKAKKNKKVRTPETPETKTEDADETPSNVIDLTALLKRSLDAASKGSKASRARRGS